MNQITIGLAGHIDHGKTSIVQSLTGKNTDSLKEEISRGMTIDIGFAHLNESISLIDVPGHERFIKNMVSGVSSINFAILVIAADDGAMPQTYEHLEILELLNIKSGLIVINKIDLVDSELLEMVELEISEFKKNTFLENCTIIKTSTKTGLGIDKLKNEILNLKKNKFDHFDRGIFGMFIDRVFTKKGFGSVVTGTVNSGDAYLGNVFDVLPSNNEIKIRGLQSHDEKVNEVKMGDRAAINLHSKNKLDIARGSHLGFKNFFSTSKSIAVKIKLLIKSKTRIKHNQRVRFHLGTQEAIGRIFLTGESSDNFYAALIKLEKDIIVSFNDRFILRSYSPIKTIGGGQVLDPDIQGKWGKISLYINSIYRTKSLSEKIEKIIEKDVLNIFSLASLSQKLSLSDLVLKKYLKSINSLVVFNINNAEWILTENQYELIQSDILLFMSKYHLNNKDSRGCLKEEINKKININVNLLEIFLNKLCEKKRIKNQNDFYSIYDFKIKLSQNDIEAKDKVLKILEDEVFITSSLESLSNKIGCDKNNMQRILKIEASNGNLVILSQSIYLTKKNYALLIDLVNKFFIKNDVMTVKDFKELTNTSRKYAVPLLEYLDKQKITYRIGNERKKIK